MSVNLTATVAQGEHWKPIVTVTDSDGDVVDLSDVTLSLAMRLKRGVDTTVTRTMGVAGETSFPASGTDGRIQFLFSPSDTAAMTVGDYRIELVYGDTDPTPDDKVIIGRGVLVVHSTATGTI